MTTNEDFQQKEADLLLKIAELKVERDNLAYENKQMAEFIKWNDKTITDDDVSDICCGTVEVWKRFRHAGFVECIQAVKSLSTIAEEELL